MTSSATAAINREAVKQRIEQIHHNMAAVLPRFDPLLQEAQSAGVQCG